MTLADVENFLRRMEGLTTIDAQTAEFRKLLSKCTVNDVRYIVRSMKHDLRTFAGPKHVLTALHPRAYDAWQASHSLKSLIDRIRDGKGLITRDLSVRASLMTAIKPMLAEACRSYERAFEKVYGGDIPLWSSIFLSNIVIVLEKTCCCLHLTYLQQCLVV